MSLSSPDITRHLHGAAPFLLQNSHGLGDKTGADALPTHCLIHNEGRDAASPFLVTRLFTPANHCFSIILK